tara:strand:- start:209 stop:373 length:165 start_codon:yes stop_codon:yes gene_type:complete
MENSIIPRGDVGCQTDLVTAHLRLLRKFYPDNAAVLITEANMSCECPRFFLGVV